MRATSPQHRMRDHAKKSVLQVEARMVKAIREARREPVQRDTFHEPVKVWDAAPTATDAEPPPTEPKVLEDNLATA